MSNLVKEEDLDIFLDDYFKTLHLPKTIGLSGPLGAGKTTIAKKVIEYFGCEEVVTSPTFNIVKNYKVKEIDIYHVDLYRLSSWAEFIDLDLPLNSENCLIIIEWINLIPEKNNLNMDIFEIEIIDEQTRKITINV